MLPACQPAQQSYNNTPSTLSAEEEQKVCLKVAGPYVEYLSMRSCCFSVAQWLLFHTNQYYFIILARFKRHLFESQIISNRLGNDDWNISPSFRRHNKRCLFKHWIKTPVAALLLRLYFDLQTGTTWQAQIRNINIRYLRGHGVHILETKNIIRRVMLVQEFQ